jgi:NitT/TauT family transport system permease protein
MIMLLIDFFKKKFSAILSLLVVVVLWELLVRFGVLNAIYLSKPSDIFMAGYELFASGKIFPHLYSSLETLLTGFLLAVIIGVIAGIFVGASEKAYTFLRPHIFILSSLPTIAIFPIILTWLGVGFWARVTIIFLMALTPILINTIDGVRNVNKKFIIMARSLGAGSMFITWDVLFFGAMPFIFSGLRSAVGRAVVGIVISELFGYGIGIGFLIVNFSGNMQIAKAIFTVILLLGISLTMTLAIAIIEKRFNYLLK